MAEEIKYNSTSMTQEIIKRTVKDYAPEAVTNKGGYTYINGQLMPKALSRILARSIRAGRIMRPGVGMTEKFVGALNPKEIMSITVQLQKNIGIHTRTLRDGGKAGTPNNDGIMNTNRKIIPATSPFEIPVRQVDDQPLFFPELALEAMLFDEVAETVGNYFDNQVNSMDSYHLAKAVSYAIWRYTNSTKKDNIITIKRADDAGYQDLAMIKMLNRLNAVMSNGDAQTGLGTFKGRRQLTATNELIGYLRSPKTGYVSNTEQGANIFYSPNFDLDETMRMGEQYRGHINGYDMQEMNQQTLDNMCAWLGLEAGSLDGILGIVTTPLSYASGGASKNEMKLLQSTEFDGVVGFPLIKFGGSAYRQIFLIVDETWTIPTKLQTVLGPASCIAPRDWGDVEYEPIERVNYDADGNPTGTTEVLANVIAPNGDKTCAVTIRVTGTDGVAVSTAVIAPTVNGATVPYTNNGDGTYQIVVPKGSVVAGTITATGYANSTISATATQTKAWTYNTTVALTAQANK